MACRHWPRFPVPSMIWVGRDLRGGGLGPLWIIRQADRRWWKWNKHSMGTCGDATPARVAPAALLLASPAGWSFVSGSRTRGPLSCTVHVSASHAAPGLRRRRVAFPPRPSRTTSRTGSNRAEREGGWGGWVWVSARALTTLDWTTTPRRPSPRRRRARHPWPRRTQQPPGAGAGLASQAVGGDGFRSIAIRKPRHIHDVARVPGGKKRWARLSAGGSANPAVTFCEADTTIPLSRARTGLRACHGPHTHVPLVVGTRHARMQPELSQG